MNYKAADKAAFKRLLYSDLDGIPADGEWWKQDTRVTFQRAGQQMMEAGMRIEAIVPLLYELYYAVAGEFGY